MSNPLMLVRENFSIETFRHANALITRALFTLFF